MEGGSREKERERVGGGRRERGRREGERGKEREREHSQGLIATIGQSKSLCVFSFLISCVFPIIQTLAREYGHYLREKNRHDEAGLMFVRAEYWQMAHDAFVTALCWQQAMCMAAHLQFDDTHMANTARTLAGLCVLSTFFVNL